MRFCLLSSTCFNQIDVLIYFMLPQSAIFICYTFKLIYIVTSSSSPHKHTQAAVHLALFPSPSRALAIALSLALCRFTIWIRDVIESYLSLFFFQSLLRMKFLQMFKGHCTLNSGLLIWPQLLIIHLAHLVLCKIIKQKQFTRQNTNNAATQTTDPDSNCTCTRCLLDNRLWASAVRCAYRYGLQLLLNSGLTF